MMIAYTCLNNGTDRYNVQKGYLPKNSKKTSKRKTLKSFKIPKPTKNIHSYDMMLI